jgi:uncharacterized protein with FMN-binding domain
MRRITLWLFATVAAVVLLFSYRTSTGGAVGSPAVATAPLSPGSSAGGSSSGGFSSGSSAGKTYSGSEASTRWGPVQVVITVEGGKITDVAVPVYPDGNRRDAEINASALPALRQETLDRQSADIDAVSGATVTSDGYRESLQAALDAAHLN